MISLTKKSAITWSKLHTKIQVSGLSGLFVYWLDVVLDARNLALVISEKLAPRSPPG